MPGREERPFSGCVSLWTTGDGSSRQRLRVSRLQCQGRTGFRPRSVLQKNASSFLLKLDPFVTPRASSCILEELSGFDRAHLVKPKDKAGFHFATPPLATPGEALGESVNLIVVATGKGEQLSDEFFQPSGAPGKTD